MCTRSGYACVFVCVCVVVHETVIAGGGKQRGVYWAYAAYDPQRGTGSLF